MPVGGPPKFVHVDGTRIQDSDEESGFDINDYDFDEDDTWTLKKVGCVAPHVIYVFEGCCDPKCSNLCHLYPKLTSMNLSFHTASLDSFPQHALPLHFSVSVLVLCTIH